MDVRHHFLRTFLSYFSVYLCIEVLPEEDNDVDIDTALFHEILHENKKLMGQMVHFVCELDSTLL